MLFPLHYWRDIIIGVLLWHQSRLYTDVCVLGYLLNEIIFGTQLSLIEPDDKLSSIGCCKHASGKLQPGF